MTVEQALSIEQKWTPIQARNDMERLLLRGERPADKVIGLAVKAFEKQIPKKVIFFCKSGLAMACPECGTFQDFISESSLNDYSPFCYKCGQALDWSEVNDTAGN